MIELNDVLRLMADTHATVESRMVLMRFDAREAHGPLRIEDVERAVGLLKKSRSAADLKDM